MRILAAALLLSDPDVCPVCRQRGHVISVRRRRGYIWRRHVCAAPQHARWSSYQWRVPPSDVDPRDIRHEYHATARVTLR